MKQEVHISIEVHYFAPNHDDILLTPGKAFPVSSYPPEARQKYKGKLGRTEIHVFASLWEGDRVYTDVSSSPLSKEYILKERLEETSYVHSTKDGFGITILKLDTGLPGMFARPDRSNTPYPISLLLKHEADARYVKGPACHMHLIPETYLRLRPTATPLPGDVQRYDVWTESTANFRRLGMPIVLGEFDGFRGREKAWQHKLLEEYMSPLSFRGYELVGFVGCLRDPATGEKSGDKKGGPYEKYEYYLSYALDGVAPVRQRITFISPYTKGDALSHLDVGRRRVFNWKEGIENLSFR